MRLNNYIRVLQLIHLVFLLIVILFIFVAIVLNYGSIESAYDTMQNQRRLLKVAGGFTIGILMAHLIPYVFFWRKMKKKLAAKKMKLFFEGSIWQWSLLALLALCLVVIFFIFPHLFVIGFFAALFIILLAKRPSHFRLLDKTKLVNSEY